MDGAAVNPARTRHVGRVIAIALLLAGLLYATLLASAPERANAIEWRCNASALRLSLGTTEIAPFNANGLPSQPMQPCADNAANSGVSQVIDSHDTLPQLDPVLRVVVQAAAAATSINPDTGPTGLQSVAATALAEGSPPPPVPAEPPTIRIGGTALRISTGVTQSFVVGTCDAAGTPIFVGNSQVADVRINGTPVPVDMIVSQVAAALNGSPLAALVAIFPNENVPTPGGMTRRALRVDIGGGQIRLILGESRAAATGDVCADRGGPPPPGQCPADSVRDPATGNCLKFIPIPAPPGQCPVGATEIPGIGCVAIVSVNGPTGATLVPVDQIPGYRNSRCATDKRFKDIKFGFVGTSGRDDITGSNADDLIFGLGGSDRISGGRGKDCIVGGTGKDQLGGDEGADLVEGNTERDTLNGGSRADDLYGGKGHDAMNGGTGNDKMFGESGRDKMVGGSGNDTLTGGPERDYIDDGQGRDSVIGGKGPDFINLAIAGPPARRIDCGSGKDILRANNNEVKKINKNCENFKRFR